MCIGGLRAHVIAYWVVVLRVFPWQRWVPAVSWCGLQCDLLSHTGLFANSSLRAEKTLQIKVPTPCALEAVQRHTRLLALFIVCGCWRLLSQFLISSWSVVSQNGQNTSQLSCFVWGRALPVGCARHLGKSLTCIIRTTHPQELHHNGVGTK